MTVPPTDFHTPQTGRIAAKLGLTWERTNRLPYDVLLAVERLIEGYERELAESRIPARDRVEGEG